VSDTRLIEPAESAIWAADVHRAAERLATEVGDDVGNVYERVSTDPAAGPDLARRVAASRGWHDLHPVVAAVIDRLVAASRALRSGQRVTIAEADLAAVRVWASAEFWGHLASAVSAVDASGALLATRYTPIELRAVGAIVRAPTLQRTLVAGSGRATIFDPVLLGGLDPIAIDVEVASDAGGVPLAGAAEIIAAAEPIALVVLPETPGGVAHLAGITAGEYDAGFRGVVVHGNAAAAAAMSAGPDRFDPDSFGRVVAIHRRSGLDLLRALAGDRPPSVEGFLVTATEATDLGAVLADLPAPRPPGASITLAPRSPTGIEAIAYRYADLITQPTPPSPSEVSPLRRQAAEAGVDLDLWLVAHAARPASTARDAVFDALGQRLGWLPLPANVASVALAVLGGAAAALSGHGAVPADELAALTGWAARPGFWRKLANSTTIAPDGLQQPFGPSVVEVLMTAVETGGAAGAMAERLGPLKTTAVVALLCPADDGGTP
jgi:hypothetical protein